LRDIFALLDVAALSQYMTQRLGVVPVPPFTSAIAMKALHDLVALSISSLDHLPPIPNLDNISSKSGAVIRFRGGTIRRVFWLLCLLLVFGIAHFAVVCTIKSERGECLVDQEKRRLEV
jgi:hypothetical protein